MSDKFFDEREDQSEVKARIVTKYFYAWARVIGPTAIRNRGRIAYIDLFAGPGRYKDGSKSTPLMIVEQAIADQKLKDHLVTMFNDENPRHAESFSAAFSEIPDISTLRFQPKISTGSIGDEIANQLSTVRLIPTFSFIDPFGYKGLSLQLINGAIKDWGCDCVFFFNYNRINAGIPNNFVLTHIEALFGRARTNSLQKELKELSPSQREEVILENIAAAIKEMGGRYVLPFRFRNAKGTRSTHHLIFVSKHVKGYEIMKDIMYHESSTYDQGVASLEYSPASALTPLLFSLAQPIDNLKESLLNVFSGRRIKMVDVYNEHHVDTPFIKRNYKDALLQLEALGQISASPVARRQSTFGDNVLVTFPPRS